MKLIPLHDYALLVHVEPPSMAGNIYLPEQREKMLPMGRIVALGPDFDTTKDTCTEKPSPSGLKEGDVVIYGSGVRIQPPGAKEYRLCRQSQVISKVEGADDLSDSFTAPAGAQNQTSAMARAAGMGRP